MDVNDMMNQAVDNLFARRANPIADRLVANARADKAATPSQLAYLKSLVAERATGQAEEALLATGRQMWAEGRLDKVFASRLIEMMQGLPRKAAPKAPAEDLKAGIYRKADGQLVRVYLGQKQGVMLAKAVHIHGTDVSYDYLGKASRFVTGDQRLPLAEVGQLGIASGTCLCCGRRLDDPESVDRGIGPVCLDKYYGGE